MIQFQGNIYAILYEWEPCSSASDSRATYCPAPGTRSKGPRIDLKIPRIPTKPNPIPYPIPWSVYPPEENTTLKDFSECLTLRGDAMYRSVVDDSTIDGLILPDQRYDVPALNLASSSSSSSSSGTKVNNTPSRDEGKMDQKHT